MRTAGKINNYSNMVGGKFERCLPVIHVQEERSKEDKMLSVNRQARTCMVRCFYSLRQGWFIPMRRKGGGLCDSCNW